MTSKMSLSLINPSRNNLKYLKWSYNSVRKNLSDDIEYCVASDYSTDGTVEWCEEISKKDKNFKYIVNDGTWFGENKGKLDRMGHTLLYDKLIDEVATGDVAMIWHSDMYALPGLDEEIFRYIDKGVVVSATRIEPPLHPPGPEKIIQDYGIEPEEFDEQKLLSEYNRFKQHDTTEGIFAPWAIYKSDFQSIGGHDKLFAPQSKEDSDIFNRFQLAGYKFIQTWRGFVYHMTCRGSRFADGAKRNPDGQVFMKNRETDEWLKQNHKSTRNFIRKWGHFVKHDAYLKPIIPPKYDIGFVVKNCSYDLLYELEPWCSTIYGNYPKEMRQMYIKDEQPNTSFDLTERVQTYYDEKNNDILVRFDGNKLTNENFRFLTSLPDIIQDSGELGDMELSIFNITITSLQTYEYDLIKVDNQSWN